MSTAVDGAADDDDEPFSGNWSDQFTDEYTVTGCKGTYSVTIKYKQDSKKRGTTEKLEEIIIRDASGGYTWGKTHKLLIRENGNVDWTALTGGKQSWYWRKGPCPRSFSPRETSLQVPMTELQRRLKLCLGSTLSDELTQPTHDRASDSVHTFVSPLDHGKN